MRRDPTEKDFAAAREFLERCPDLSADVREERLQFLAKLHAVVGRSKFRLYVGLREPRNRIEAFDLELHRGPRLHAEVLEELNRYANRPVDEEMINNLFDHLERSVGHYSKFLQIANHYGNKNSSSFNPPKGEAILDRRVTRMSGKFQMHKRELKTAFECLDEIRIENRSDLVRVNDFSATTAAGLSLLVTKYARDAWRSCRMISKRSQASPRYTYSITPVELFYDVWFDKMPRPQDVTTLLHQERTMARIALRKWQSPPANSALKAETVNVQIEANQASVALQGAAFAGAPDQEEQGPDPLLTVKRWPDLAIGIDEKGAYWGISAVPSLGDTFPKSQAVQLPLAGEQWKLLLDAFAKSESGDRVERWALAKAMDCLPPASEQARDQRGRPLDLEAAEGLGRQQSPVLHSLNQILRNLSRRLRGYVDGPTGRQLGCLRVEGQDIYSGFVVRYLLQDDNRNLRFGHRKGG